MQITETQSEGLKRELKVVVPASELEAKLTSRLEEMRPQVRLNGFRPGKVPLGHLRRVYGKNVMAEVIQQTVNEVSQKTLADRDERPAFQPDIAFPEDAEEIGAVMEGKSDLAYSMSFEVLPRFELADFSKLELTRLVADVPEAEVDDALGRIAEANKPYEDKGKDAAAAIGDRVSFDFEGSIEGEPFEGGAGTGAALVLGSGQFIPGFEDQLVGIKAGDEKTVTVTFPEDYQAAHLAGKTADFKVKAHEVQAPGELAIDDDFAKTLGIDSLDQLKETIRGQLGENLVQATKGKLKRALLDALDEAHDFELPPTLVEREFHQIWHQLEHDMEHAGRSFEDEGENEEETRQDYRKIAERRVRLGLVLAEVGEKNDIQITEEEVNRVLMDQARQFPGQEQALWEYYRKNPDALAALRAPIFEDKVVDFIIDQAQVREEKVTPEELMRNPDEDEEEGAKADADAKKPAKKAAPRKKAARKAEPAADDAAKDDAGKDD